LPLCEEIYTNCLVKTAPDIKKLDADQQYYMPIGEPQLACMVASTLTALISSMPLFDRSQKFSARAR
jgi:hypothetical protein